MNTVPRSILRIVLLATALLGTNGYAAVTDIADSPLATSGNTSVKPNVLFILDDSGSMNWDYMPDDSNSPYFPIGKYGYVSTQCNGVYYNPNVTYALPVDAAGLAYPNASFTAAKVDGFDAASTTKNLSTSFAPGIYSDGGSHGGTAEPAYYYTYSGTQTAQTQKQYTNTASTFFRECNSTIGSTPGSAVFSKVVVSATSGPGGTDERQNFANWYSYYRTRIATMKSAAGLAFKNIDNKYRVGFSTISYTGTDSTNSHFLKISDYDSPQKTSWYSKLYAATPSSSTPLRGALSKAGRIYAGQLLTGANDPVQYSCQQNFTILSTDGYWNTGNETSSYGPKKIDNSTNVGQQDGAEIRPYLDGAITTYTRSTSQIQQRQDQITQSTSQLLQRTTQIQRQTSTLQKQISQLQQDVGTLQNQTSALQTRAGTLQGTLSKVLMRCNNTAAVCGTAPATGVANANWSVVTAGSCTVATNMQCSVVSGLSGNVNVATSCNTAASITSTSGTGTVTITITNSNNVRIGRVRANGSNGTDILSGTTSSSSTNSTVASRIAANINACTGSTTGNCDVSGHSATVSGNVVTVSGPNITSGFSVSISSGSATISISYSAGAATHTLNNADSNGKVYSACSYNWGAWTDAAAACTVNKSTANPYTVTSATDCQYTGWSGWANSTGACTAAAQDNSNLTARQCQYTWNNAQGTPSCSTPAYAAGDYSSTSVYRNCQTVVTTPYANAASCTATAPDAGGNSTQCQYTGWSAWANASSCTDTPQSTAPNYTVGTATQCQILYNGDPTDCAAAGTVTNGGQCYVGASSCSPGSSGGQTVSCVGPVVTGTYVSACVDQTASSSNGWTTTTCTTNSIQAPTPVASCTAVAPTAANSYVTTSCNTVTTGPTSVPTCTAASPSAANSYTTTTCSIGSTTGGTSNTLADVAEYYYKTDLRTSALGNCTGAQGAGVDVCENNVPGGGVDVNPQQHMTTFTLGLGANGTLIYSDSYLSGGSADYNAIVNGTKDWPDPTPTQDGTRIDDLWHAGVNGRGVYYSAKDSTSLVTGLSNALAGVTARAGAAAAAATSSLEPVEGDNYLFIALYRTVFWDGDLLAKTIDPASGAISDTAVWSAQTELDKKASAASDTRTIYAFDGSTASKLKPFTWAALNGTEQGYFNSMCSPTALLSQCPTLTLAEQANASGQNLVNYLRGQSGNEGTLYRDREHVLGDMVSSQPVYVKSPPFSYVDAGYDAYKSGQASRTPMVYVAANDGMLHAFDAASGTEQWAYVPPMIMSNMYRLADKSYAANHRYYVDGSPTVADICPSAPASACDASQWKTILVGGLNAGGRGYYALDITNPAAPKGLWNFTTANDADLGYTFGNPVVSKRKDGTWVVAFTSGYNNVSSGDGKGYLYVVNANSGTLLEKIGTNTGTTTTPSGLSKINVWINTDTDNTAERFYGGDLLGNLWRFTLDSGLPPAAPVSTAGSAFLLAEVGQINGAGVQPITTKPELTVVPYNGTDYMVVEFGTGRYLGLTDKSNIDQQTVYAIKDDLSNTGLGLVRTSGTLVPQTLSEFTGPNGETLRTVATPQTVDWSAKSGWFVDLNPGNTSPGERVNVDVQLQLGSLTVAANVPSSNACNVGGYSFLYHFDFKSGSYLPTAALNAVGSKLTSNTLVAGMNTVRLTSGKIYTIVCGTDGVCRPEETPPPVPSSGALKRSTWREIIQ